MGIAKSGERCSRRCYVVLLRDHGDPAILQDEGILDVRHFDCCKADLEQTLIGLRRLHQVAAETSEQVIPAFGAAFGMCGASRNQGQGDP